MIDHDIPIQGLQPAFAEAPAGPAVTGRGSTGQGGDAGGRLRQAGSRFALRNWRVRWRLLALIAVPAVAVAALGSMRVASAAHSAATFRRVAQLAVLGRDVTQLAQAMQDERDLTAGFTAAGQPAAGLAVLRKQYAVTDLWAARVGRLALGIGAGAAHPPPQLAGMLASVDDLAGLREGVVNGKPQPLSVISDYSQAVAGLLEFNDNIGLSCADPALTGSVRMLGLLSRMKDQASQRRAILYAALIERRFGPGALTALAVAQAQQASEVSAYLSSASAAAQRRYAGMVSGPLVDQAKNLQQRAMGSATGPLMLNMAGAPASRQWYTAMSDTIARMRAVESQQVASIVLRSRALERAAARSAAVTTVTVLCVLLLVLAVTAIIARSMVGPLRRLRAGALEVAEVRLPQAVRQLGESGGGGETFEVEPINVTSADEVGEVARAFDRVHREALQLAASEAMLRSNVSAMFVSLSRRSQSLVERQIKLIDELEQGEQDAERLASLFRMDHLATRMRRNSENLLVLAGHEAARRREKPVALVDVLRAAVSEIEQYERVTLNIEPGTSVAGNAVKDVIHLLAELLENATSFSPAGTPVNVTGQLLNSGGVLLDITDRGAGLGAHELAHANWRLENPPVVDVAVSRRMGLFVVARLAARHRIRVRLRQPESGGLTALIWLPATVISLENVAPAGWMRRSSPLPPGHPAGPHT